MPRIPEIPLDERLDRWRALMENVREKDVMWWLRCFVSVLNGDGIAADEAQSLQA